MQYIRIFLINLRKMYAKGYKDAMKKFAIASALGLIGGFVLDLLLPFNVIFNSVRAIVSIGTGIVIYALFYLYSLNSSFIKERNDDGYIPIRKQFSYKQRINISILGFGIVAGFLLIINKSGPMYTLFSSLSIASMIALLAFVRTYKYEYIKAEHGILDARDLNFNKQKRANDK